MMFPTMMLVLTSEVNKICLKGEKQPTCTTVNANSKVEMCK